MMIAQVWRRRDRRLGAVPRGVQVPGHDPDARVRADT